jgi:lambda repressor-like predicted transcriptional regulator
MQTNSKNKLAFWKRKHQEYRKSGLSRRDFSRQNGVNKSTLDYWFARISKEENKTALVEVKPTRIRVPDHSLRIVVADKYRIEVHRGFDPILFTEVVKALESLR